LEYTGVGLRFFHIPLLEGNFGFCSLNFPSFNFALILLLIFPTNLALIWEVWSGLPLSYYLSIPKGFTFSGKNLFLLSPFLPLGTLWKLGNLLTPKPNSGELGKPFLPFT